MAISNAMPDVRYLVSARFDYSQWLCADAGPQYAESLGLAWEQFDPERLMASEPHTVWVLDPRLQSDEVLVLEDLAWRLPRLWLIPRVVDPGWPPADQNPLRKLAFRLARRNRSFLLLAYQPAEVTELLADAFGVGRWHVSPYPYLVDRELKVETGRRNKVLITGSPAPDLYPLRALARRKRLTSLRWRLRSEDLAHPGYEARSRELSACIGEGFVARLAAFRFMFLCPSRMQVELLKYGECGYAGCAPVGAPAKGLPARAASCVIPFDPADTPGSIRRIAETSEQEAIERALHFRLAMAQERSPCRLYQSLIAWLTDVQAGAKKVSQELIS